LPELGGDIEVIETANPRTYYDLTRRKLGMVLGMDEGPTIPCATTLANLFIIGDTVSSAPQLDAVVELAISLSNQLTK
jgi:hypothetical protein